MEYSKDVESTSDAISLKNSLKYEIWYKGSDLPKWTQEGNILVVVSLSSFVAIHSLVFYGNEWMAKLKFFANQFLVARDFRSSNLGEVPHGSRTTQFLPSILKHILAKSYFPRLIACNPWVFSWSLENVLQAQSIVKCEKPEKSHTLIAVYVYVVHAKSPQ